MAKEFEIHQLMHSCELFVARLPLNNPQQLTTLTLLSTADLLAKHLKSAIQYGLSLNGR